MPVQDIPFYLTGKENIMNITLNSSNAKYYLKQMEKVISKRAAKGNESSYYVYMNIDHDTATLESNNYDCGMKVVLPASELCTDVTEPGTILFPSIACNVVYNTSESVLVKDHGNKINLSIADDKNIKMQMSFTHDERIIEQFVRLQPKPVDGTVITVKAKPFLHSLIVTSKNCEAREEMKDTTGLNLAVKADKLQIGGGRTGIMCICEQPIIHANVKETTLILPGTSVSQLAQIMLSHCIVNKIEDLSVVFKDHGCFFDCGNATWFINTLSESVKPIDFQLVADHYDFSDCLNFNKSYAIECISRLKNFAEKDTDFYCTPETGKLKLELTSRQNAFTYKDELTAASGGTVNSDNEAVKFDPRLFCDTFIDSCHELDNEVITVSCAQSDRQKSPMKISCGGYSEFVMPVAQR